MLKARLQTRMHGWRLAVDGLIDIMRWLLLVSLLLQLLLRLHLEADRSLSHDHPSSKQSSAPSIIVKAEGYHKMVSHMSPNRALIKILLKAERIVGSPDQSVPSVALTQIVTPIATRHHGTLCVRRAAVVSIMPVLQVSAAARHEPPVVGIGRHSVEMPRVPVTVPPGLQTRLACKSP